jgi:hypothetical protein
MSHRPVWMAAALVLAVAAVLLADAPATQSTGDPTDTFRAFLLDIQQGNPTDLAKICSANGRDAEQLKQDFQAIASAIGDLRRAAAQKWGPEAADAAVPALPSLGDLDDTAEKIVGDHAEVGGGSVWLVHLVRLNGKWMLDLDWLAHSDDMPQNSRWFAAMATAIHRTADDISNGRLTTIGAAAEAIQAREQAIPDTTEPTTKP